MSPVSAALLFLSPTIVSSCATGFSTPLHMRDGPVAKAQQHEKRQVQLVTAPSANTTHWSIAANLREMQVTDDAFVKQDLANFNHAAALTVYQPGGSTRNLSEHLTDMRLVFSMFPDMQLQNHNYLLRFGEGDWTVVISKVTGTNGGPLPWGTVDGETLYLPPTHRYTHYPLMTIGRWEHGLLQDEYLFDDSLLSYRQLGLLPDAPRANLPEMYFDPMGNPGPDASAWNKKNANASDAALNAGSTDPTALLYSRDLNVYGLSDDPMDLDQYTNYLQQMRQAFPDLTYTHQQVIAQGEWTATLGMLSGTQRGAWRVPAYVAANPIPATNKSFDLLHYVIARWENGEVVDMRVNLDMIGILGVMGVQI